MVIYKHRGHAVVGCAVHAPPITVALLLCYLNATQFYIGGELSGVNGQDSQKLAGLIFAAKIHELLFLASLGSIIFTYIRWEVTVGDGLPFGALLSGYQFESLSFLWSLEMVGTILQKWGKRRKRILTISLMIICTILGVSVGPSSSNLMRLRLDEWPAGGSNFWVEDSIDKLFAQKLDDSPDLASCKMDVGDLSCPSAGWEVLNSDAYSLWPRLRPIGSLVERIYLPSPFSLRKMSVRCRSSNYAENPIWSDAYSVATIPSSVIADGIAEVSRPWSRATIIAKNRRRFRFRRDVVFSAQARQAVAVARCEESSWTDSSTGPVALKFPVLSTITLNSGQDTGEISSSRVDRLADWSDLNTTEQLKTIQSAGNSPSLIWIDEADLLRTINGTLAIIAAVPQTEANSTGGTLYCCSIDSRLAPATVSATRSSPKSVSGAPDGFASSGTFNTNWNPVMLSAAWAGYLNPRRKDSNDTIFPIMASTAGMWNSTLPSAPCNYVYIIEYILSTIVANDIGRSSFNTTLVKELKDALNSSNEWSGGAWYEELLPKSSLGLGGDAFNTSSYDPKSLSKFTVEAKANGYAYSSRGIVQKASIVTLLSYSALSIAYVIYSVATGWATTHGDTATQLTALALNSEPTKEMNNTGAGIATLDVYSKVVSYRVDDANGNLKMVFEKTKSATNAVRLNERYG